MSARRPSGATAARRLRGSAPVFAALGDETRLSLVAKLCGGSPRSISQLTEGCSVTRQAVTKHLFVLADAGLVRGVRRGRESLWELKPRQLDEARGWLEQISKHWDDALARLKAAAEAEHDE